MVGSLNIMTDRKGGYIIPKKTSDGTNDTYIMTLPYGTEVLGDNISFTTTPNVTITDTGFASNIENYLEVEFSVPVNTPITVYNGKSILYVSRSNNEFKLIRNMRVNGDIATSTETKVVFTDTPLIEY